MTPNEADSAMILICALFDAGEPSLFDGDATVPSETEVRRAAKHLRNNAERAIVRGGGFAADVVMSRTELANARLRVVVPEPARSHDPVAGPGEMQAADG